MDSRPEIAVLPYASAAVVGDHTAACGVTRKELNGTAEAQEAVIGEFTGRFYASTRGHDVNAQSCCGTCAGPCRGIPVTGRSTSTPIGDAATLSETIASSSVGIGCASGKVILIGEHVAVYGLPAIAVPLPDLTIEATVAFAPLTGVFDDSISLLGDSATRPPVCVLHPPRAAGNSGLAMVVEAAMRRWGITDETVEVRIKSRVPPARGMGFSAAAATAAVRGLADLVGARLDNRVLYELVQGGEQIAHGRASGIDAAAVAAATPIRFEAGVARPLVIDHDAILVVADTGIAGSTLCSVARVRSVLEHAWASRRLAQAGAIIESAEASLTGGRLTALGAQLNRFHSLLREFGVSTPEIELLVDAALAGGALGAKLTGGGMGGCVLALAEPSYAATVRAALDGAGACRIWMVPMGGGAR